MRSRYTPTNTPCLEQFVEFYYKTFDSDRSQLASLYGPDSMLTFEAAPSQGVADIVQKLVVQPKHIPSLSRGSRRN